MLPLLLLTCMLAQAPADRPALRGNRPPGLGNGELVNMLDTYAIVQAQDALQIPDSQYGQFVARLKHLQQVRRQSTRARNRILQDLRLLAQNPSADDDALRERLQALDDAGRAAADDLRRAAAAVDELLDPRQRAKFRLFEERMERQKLDLLMRARARAAPRDAQPPKPGGTR